MMHCRTITTAKGHHEISAEALRAVLKGICCNLAARARRSALFYGYPMEL